ncbi:MAG TPA: helix-turn-helix transcriptional regulator [Solirubrobacterales bacterium]|jgi:transcriptional regulator with XRE-family HTH domain|nr:helix-turn-helix transcriptional regulator [Solirubrobacterales bacterium]
MEAAKQFGRNLHSARRQAEMTQDRLAAEAFMHRAAVSRMENGLQLPRLDHMVWLAAGMGVQVRDLLRGIR